MGIILEEALLEGPDRPCKGARHRERLHLFGKIMPESEIIFHKFQDKYSLLDCQGAYEELQGRPKGQALKGLIMS